MHWLTQPRDMNGRFMKSGGGGGDWDFKGFWKLPTWGKWVYVAAMIGVLIWSYKQLAIFAAIVFVPVLFLSDWALDQLLPDPKDEEESE